MSDHVAVAYGGSMSRDDRCKRCGVSMLYRVDAEGERVLTSFCGHVECSAWLLEIPEPTPEPKPEKGWMKRVASEAKQAEAEIPAWMKPEKGIRHPFVACDCSPECGHRGCHHDYAGMGLCTASESKHQARVEEPEECAKFRGRACDCAEKVEEPELHCWCSRPFPCAEHPPTPELLAPPVIRRVEEPTPDPAFLNALKASLDRRGSK